MRQKLETAASTWRFHGGWQYYRAEIESLQQTPLNIDALHHDRSLNVTNRIGRPSIYTLA